MKTYRHGQALNFIRGYIASNDIAPTMAEIGEYLGVRSSKSVFDILVALENSGLIERTPNISRGIKVIRTNVI